MSKMSFWLQFKSESGAQCPNQRKSPIFIVSGSMGVSAKDISNFEYRGHRRDIGGGFFNSVGM